MSTPDDSRRTAFVARLRQIADLAESGLLPVPIIDVSVSVWFDERENGRERAAVVAEALGVDWKPERPASTSGGPAAALARANLRPAPLELAMWLKLGSEPEPDPTPPPAGIAFAAELTAAARGEA